VARGGPGGITWRNLRVGTGVDDRASTNSPSLRHSSLSTFSTGIRHGRRIYLPPLRGSLRRRVDRRLRVADTGLRCRCRRGYAGLRELLADASLPAGVKLERSGVHAIVSIARSEGVDLVRVQFDVPEGLTLVLREDAIGIDARDGGVPRHATIPHINRAAPARYPETPVIQKLVLPVDPPLRGGRIHAGTLSSDRHYWIAAPVEGDLGREIWISLPGLSVDGTPARFPEIKFTRHFTIGRGSFNC